MINIETLGEKRRVKKREKAETGKMTGTVRKKM